MKPLLLLLAIIVAFWMLSTGCKKDIQADTNMTPQVLQAEGKALIKPSARFSPALKAKLANMPAGYEKRLALNASFSLKMHPEYQNMALRAMQIIGATPCDESNLLFQWLYKQLGDWDSETLFWAAYSGMLFFPAYDALLFENSVTDQYFGTNQQYTHRVTKTFKDLQRFWNIQSRDIVLHAMHGSMLHNRERLIRMDMILFGDSRDVAEYWADLILMLIKEVPQYRNGNHPVFTFNAFAQSSFDFPPYGKIPNKVVIGDGIIEALSAIGYGDVAPQAIVAHEFGHHIQFQLNVFGNEISPEATRRTELMADSYAGYYLSHARGATMQWKRVQQFLQVFYNIGDCGVNDLEHHGTPKQRLAAAQWAYNVANNAQKQGHIMPSQKFTKLFEAQLPRLVKY